MKKIRVKKNNIYNKNIKYKILYILYRTFLFNLNINILNLFFSTYMYKLADYSNLCLWIAKILLIEFAEILLIRK